MSEQTIKLFDGTSGQFAGAQTVAMDEEILPIFDDMRIVIVRGMPRIGKKYSREIAGSCRVNQLTKSSVPVRLPVRLDDKIKHSSPHLPQQRHNNLDTVCHRAFIHRGDISIPLAVHIVDCGDQGIRCYRFLFHQIRKSLPGK